MTAMEKIEKCGVVPVVVLDRAEDAVPTAEAMLRGGVNVMEITFRTAAAPDAIRAVAQACPDMLVGAGTVITLERKSVRISGFRPIKPWPHGAIVHAALWSCRKGSVYS